MQRKPVVGPPDDRFEREADRVANEVVHGHQAPAISATPSQVQRECDGCRDDDEADLQRKPSGESGRLDGGKAARVTNTGGQPLSPALRSYFEPRFGHDFGRVRIHDDAHAAEGARAIQARAYTHGRHIVFGQGQYAPDTVGGRRLLAHELTHTIQQGAATSATLQRQPAPAQTPAPAVSGEDMRKQILDRAQAWVDKQFTTQDDIEAIRKREVIVAKDLPEYTAEGMPGEQLGLSVRRNDPAQAGAMLVKTTPFENYTTCVSFAQMVFKEAAQAKHPDDLKQALRVAELLPNLFRTYAAESQAEFTIDLLQQQMNRYTKDEAKRLGARDDQAKTIADLEGQTGADASQETVRQQKLSVAKIKLKQLDAALEQLLTAKKRQQGLIDAQELIRGDLRKQNAAWIKPDVGLANGGPKPGDMIILGKVSSGFYGVSGTTQVPLHKSAFLHISVLESVEETEQGGVQIWQTIDGGGTTGKKTPLYVRLADFLVFHAKPLATKPEHQWQEKPPPRYSLLGWFDTARMYAQHANAPAATKP